MRGNQKFTAYMSNGKDVGNDARLVKRIERLRPELMPLTGCEWRHTPWCSSRDHRRCDCPVQVTTATGETIRY